MKKSGALASPKATFGLIGIAWLAGIVVIVATINPAEVTVVHWANGHMMDRETLLPAFAAEFNAAEHRTSSGKVIRVQLVRANSGEIAGEIVSRVVRRVPIDRAKADPTLVTPAADHWLNDVNHAVGRDLLDIQHGDLLATTYVGIVTTREMAECLGWPDKEIGFSEVVGLATDQAGWQSYPCAKAEWGKEALIAFTYPSRSSTARSVLYALYSVAAGKAPADLTLQDLERPGVTDSTRRLQSALDCYIPDTLDLNTKIVQAPSCAHFYFLAEDNLVKLYQGKIEVLSGNTRIAKALERDLVMIYPKEGSLVHNHSAFLVPGPWMTPEQREGAEAWVQYIQATPQQHAFQQEGFRSAASLPCVDPIGSPFSPCSYTPSLELYPDAVPSEVAAAILKSWR